MKHTSIEEVGFATNLDLPQALATNLTLLL